LRRTTRFAFRTQIKAINLALCRLGERRPSNKWQLMLMAMHKHAFAARNAAPFIYLFGHRMRVHRPEHNRCITARGVAGAARQKLRCRRLRKVAPAAAAGRSRNGAKGWRFSFKRRPKGHRHQKPGTFIRSSVATTSVII
jgi:hypothetical protein